MTIAVNIDNQFRQQILNGKKVSFTSMEQQADVGDTFDAFGKQFMITEVYHSRLDHVAYCYFEEEGWWSPLRFMQDWNLNNPENRYLPQRMVYLHLFVAKKG